jgi:glycosyltransferase involved in cell wall biosynthesis
LVRLENLVKYLKYGKIKEQEVRMRRICLIIPSLQPGGMEQVMCQLAFFFCKKNNIEIHLILFGRDPQIFYNIPDKLIIHRPKTKFNNNLRLISSLRRICYLRCEIQSMRPDSILSFGEYWNSFVLLALSGLKYKVTISDRCSPDKNLGFVHEKLRKWLYTNAFGIIVQTYRAKEVYQNIIKGSSIKVIGNPIREISLFHNVAKENIVLTVGRLIPSKNHARLIESFVRLNKPDWKLIIVGGDALKMNLMEDLKALINKLGVKENIILTGNRSDVDIFYRKSKIFVFTSQSEGFPNVIGEAMVTGLPVVAFDCVAGPSEMITDGKDGFLVPLFDFKLMEEKLLILMNDTELREKFGRAAMTSMERFSVDKIGEEYYSFIT